MTGLVFWAVFVWLAFLLVCAVAVVAGWVRPETGARPWLVLLICPALLVLMAAARWWP